MLTNHQLLIGIKGPYTDKQGKLTQPDREWNMSTLTYCPESDTVQDTI